MEKQSTGAEKDEGKGRKAYVQPKVCYKCGEKVHPDATHCPHCGAGPSKFNPAWVLRVVIGMLLGLFAWLIFYGG